MHLRVILQIMTSFGLLFLSLILIHCLILLCQHLPRLFILLLDLIPLNPVRIDPIADPVHLSNANHACLLIL